MPYQVQQIKMQDRHGHRETGSLMMITCGKGRLKGLKMLSKDLKKRENITKKRQEDVKRGKGKS